MEEEQTSSIHSELSEASDNLELINPIGDKLTRVGLSLEELIKFEKTLPVETDVDKVERFIGENPVS